MSESEMRIIYAKLDDLKDIVVRLEERQINISSQVSAIGSVQCTLGRDGCEIGRKHERDIKELQERPAKLGAIMAGLAGFVSFITGLVTWIIANKGENH